MPRNRRKSIGCGGGVINSRRPDTLNPIVGNGRQRRDTGSAAIRANNRKSRYYWLIDGQVKRGGRITAGGIGSGPGVSSAFSIGISIPVVAAAGGGALLRTA